MFTTADSLYYQKTTQSGANLPDIFTRKKVSAKMETKL